VSDLKTALLNAIREALDAHTVMSTQALNSPSIQNEKDIRLNHARLWESLREPSASETQRTFGLCRKLVLATPFPRHPYKRKAGQQVRLFHTRH
jgi:hypothetical protein